MARSREEGEGASPAVCHDDFVEALRRLRSGGPVPA